MTLVFAPFIISMFWGLPTMNWSNVATSSPNISGKGTLSPSTAMAQMISNVLWNMQGFSVPGGVAGQVKDIETTFPRAMIASCALASAVYILPLIVATGNSLPDWGLWDSGYLAIINGEVVGYWMKVWSTISTVLGQFGMLVSGAASLLLLIEGMAHYRMLPPAFKNTKVSVLVLSALALGFTAIFMMPFLSDTFEIIVTIAALLGAFNMVLQLWATVYFRYKHPDVERPYKVPGGMRMLIACAVIPTLLTIYIFVTSDIVPMAGTAGCVAIGLLVGLVNSLNRKRLMKKLSVSTTRALDAALDKEQLNEGTPKSHHSDVLFSPQALDKTRSNQSTGLDAHRVGVSHDLPYRYEPESHKYDLYDDPQLFGYAEDETTGHGVCKSTNDVEYIRSNELSLHRSNLTDFHDEHTVDGLTPLSILP